MEMRVFAALIRDAPALRYTPSEYAAAILARCLILLKGGKKKKTIQCSAPIYRLAQVTFGPKPRRVHELLKETRDRGGLFISVS